MKLRHICIVVPVLMLFTGCASSGGTAQDRLNANREKAAAAVSEMQGGGRNTSSVSAQTAPPKPQITKDRAGKPNWVDNPESAYNKNYYISAVGHGSGRGQAEQNALGNLVAVFGQSVQSNIHAVETYNEQVRSGAIDVSSSVSAQQAVRTQASMDALIGAEIDGRWDDGKTYYAIAIMDKAKGCTIYADLLDANLKLIDAALDLSAQEKNSLEGVARYYFAAQLADVNSVFKTVLSVLGDNSRRNLVKGDDYRLQAKKAAMSIPVNISVTGDKHDLIKGAFASVFSNAGFKTGNSASRYVLRAKITLEPVKLPNENKWTRYIVDASLMDNDSGMVLFPFNINGREGHISQEEADNRAIRDAVETIKEEYTGALKSYLAGTI